MSQKYDYYKQPEKTEFIEKLIPYGLPNRSGKEQIPEYIVIHEVSLGLGKSPKNYNINHYANQIVEQGKSGRSIGYHYLAGDKEIYQFLKDTEATDHTGTKEGNSNSIGIERLICEGINYEHALFNQAKLAATLMIKWNIPIEKVVTHKMMQELFPNKNSGYELKIKDFNPEILNKNIFTKENYYELYKKTDDFYKYIYDKVHNSDFVETKHLKGIEIWEDINFINQIKETLQKFDNLPNFDKLNAISNLLNVECKFKKIICNLHDRDYLPLEKTINNITFIETPIQKNCPSRLIAGQRGGMEKFYRQIEHCLNHNNLFEEILTNEINFQR